MGGAPCPPVAESQDQRRRGVKFFWKGFSQGSQNLENSGPYGGTGGKIVEANNAAPPASFRGIASNLVEAKISVIESELVERCPGL